MKGNARKTEELIRDMSIEELYNMRYYCKPDKVLLGYNEFGFYIDVKTVEGAIADYILLEM